MSIDATVHSQANSEADFERFFAKHEKRARKRARWLARHSRLGIDAEDDIFIVAMNKLWRTYWQLGVRKRYEYRSEIEDWALVCIALDTALLDLLRKEQEVGNLVGSLDDPSIFQGHGDSTTTLADFIAAPDNVSDEAILNVTVEDVLNQKFEETKSDGIKHTIHYLLGEGSLEDCLKALYNANCVRVAIHHLKRAVKLALRSGDARNCRAQRW